MSSIDQLESTTGAMNLNDVTPTIKGTGKHWTAKLVRETFINFFVEKKGHTFIPSSAVVPHDDPTLLFCNAGMNQFKPIFLGQVDPKDPRAKLTRATNSQKCIRAGGKHNDLDDVGKDLYHHTFFEMLGNWSFGDFGKQEIIDWSWELLTEVYGLDPSRLYASYYEGDENGVGRDDEARQFWERHLPPSHVIPFDAKENFWEMGDTGPCGPCSEITYDRIGGRDASHLVNADDPDVLEIWNLVFMTKNRLPGGALEDLPAANVDTGMGFERLVSCLQDVPSNYDTDVFTPLFKAIEDLSPLDVKYTGKVGEADVGSLDMAFRVVADHIRTLTIAISDGGTPSNVGRGYVVRRVLRRAARYGRDKLQLDNFLHKLVPVVVESLGESFPQLVKKMEFVQEIIKSEEETFQRTLSKGLEYFEKQAASLKESGESVVPTETVFFLYSTMGFPADLTELMAEERGLTVDMGAFVERMESEKQMSREAGKSSKSNEREIKKFEAKETSKLEDELKVEATIAESKYDWFVQVDAKVMAIYDGDDFVDSVTGDTLVAVVLDRSPFYFESGGQLADFGALVSENGASLQVEDCQSAKGFIMHIGALSSPETTLKVGDSIKCEVDYERRGLLANNHTGTHILNLGLRKVLGGEIDQKGSEVAPEKFRFDYNSKAPMKPEQAKAVEQLVRDQINEARAVYTKVVPLADAKKVKALRAVFGETYPDPVRVVVVGAPVDDVIADPDNEKWFDYSVELCGGTHLRNSADAKDFVLVEDSGIGGGLRRIVGLTGDDAIEANERGATLHAQVVEAGFLPEEKLEPRQKELLATVAQAVISSYLKAELDATLKKYGKRVFAFMKAKKDAEMQKGMEEAQVLAEAAKEANSPYIIAVLKTPGNIATKIAASVAKVAPEVSVCVLMRDEDKSKLQVATLVTKAQQTKSGAAAGDWLKAINEVADGKGGGKADRAVGQASLDKIDLAEEAANKYAAEKLM